MPSNATVFFNNCHGNAEGYRKNMSTSTLKNRTAKRDIYHRLRSEILNGRRRPGQRLAIDLLKDEFGTSITPVRDALQMLNQEGLISIKPRSGYFVTQITLKELRDMLEMREILEIAAVERAAKHITLEQIKGVKSVHAGYTGDDEASYTRYTDENRNFHCLVAEASGNHELAGTLSRLLDRLGRFMVIRHAGKEMNQSHDALIQCLEAHDGDRAKKVLLKELTETRHSILDRIMQEEAAFWHLGAAGNEN